jgi:hypothetical protein
LFKWIGVKKSWTDIEYEFSKEDAIEFELYVQKNNPTLKNKTQNGKYILVVYFILSILVSIGFFIRGDDLVGVLGIIIGLFLIYGYWATYSIRNLRHRIKKVLETDTVKIPNAYYCKRKIIIEPDSIKNVSDFWEEKTYWSGIVEVAKSEQYIYLFETHRVAFVIPKRAFTDDNSFNLFAEMAKEFQAKAALGQTNN